MKIDKEFTLGDSSVNCYGFRLLTGGYQLQMFANNPIGFYMHIREGGVVVRWADLRIMGDRIVGKPDINMSNARGQQTYDEVNNGFLNAGSFGHIIALEMSDDEKLKLPGQTGPTVTKWYNRECSLVDIPGNFNALIVEDEDGNQLSLPNLKAKSALKLSGDSLEERKKLIDKAIEDKDINALEANTLKRCLNEPEVFKQALALFKQQRIDYLNFQSYDDLEKNELLEELKTKDFDSFKDKYKTKFNKDYDGKEQDKTSQTSLSYLQSLSYEELDRKGLAADLLRLDAPGFNAKFKALFGRDYQNLSTSSATAATNTMQPAKPAVTNPRLSYLQSLNWDELDRKNGFLEELKNLDEQRFNDKFKAKFGKDWKPQKNNAIDKARSAQADQDEAKKRLTDLQAMSFDELDRKGLLAELKVADIPSYNAKFKSVFGINPNN